MVWSRRKRFQLLSNFCGLCFSQCFSRRRSPCERSAPPEFIDTSRLLLLLLLHHYNRTSNSNSVPAKRGRKKIHSLHHDHHRHHHCCCCCCALDTKNTQTPFMLLIHHETGQLLFLSHIYAICTTQRHTHATTKQAFVVFGSSFLSPSCESIRASRATTFSHDTFPMCAVFVSRRVSPSWVAWIFVRFFFFLFCQCSCG